MGSPFCKYFLTINNLYNDAKSFIYLLRLLRYDFYILNIDFRFGQEVKVKLGSPCKYFLNDAKIVNLPLVVDIRFFLMW